MYVAAYRGLSKGVSAETDAICRAATLLQEATVDEPQAYWQAVLDELEPLVDFDVLSNASIAFKYVVALRDRTPSACSREDRAACIADAIVFLCQPQQFPR